MTERDSLPTFTHTWEGHTQLKIAHWINCGNHNIESTMSKSDLEQEAFIIWMRCCDRYPHIEDGKHFYSLFFSSVNRFVIDQHRRSHLINAPTEHDADTCSNRDTIAEEEFLMLVEDAPADVREILYKILVEGKSIRSPRAAQLAVPTSHNLWIRVIKWYEGTPQTV